MALEVAQRLRQALPDAGYYRWTFAGAPVKIDLSLDVAADLRAELERIPNDATRRFAGVLTGNAGSYRDGPRQITVDGFVTIPFDPNGEGEASFERRLIEFIALRADKSVPQACVVGYFLAQPDAAPAATPAVDSINRSLIAGVDIALLIATGRKQKTAGFLFRDGDAFTPFSLLSFPLDAAVLKERASERRRTTVSHLSAQLPARVNLSSNGGGESKPAANQRRTTLAIGSIVAVLGLLVSTIIALRPRPKLERSPVSGPGSVSAPLVAQVDLEVEAHANGLNLAWSPDASAVRNAAAGQMIVNEQGRAQRIIPLDAPLLHNGRLFYVPSSDSVRFCLELKDARNQVSTACTLALLTASSEKSVAAGAVPPPRRAAPLQGVSVPAPVFHVRQAPIESIPILDTSRQAVLRPFVANTPLRPIETTPESSGSNVAAIPPSEVARQVAAEQIAAPTVTTSAVGETNRTAAPAPAAATVSPDIPASPTPVRTSALVNYKVPVAKYEAMPRLDPVFRSMIVGETEIDINVSIDDSGKVVRAEIVGGTKRAQGPLAAAALAAAQRWVFVPARANGKPVPSEHLIQFKFKK